MSCKNCDEIVKEVEDLRKRLASMIDSYSNICEELWKISHKQREVKK